MEAFIDPPKKIPLFIGAGIWISRKITGKDLLPGKLLAWFPKAAIGSGLLESLIAKENVDMDGRLLKLVRIQVSFTVSCAFCIDMNSFDYDKMSITDNEIVSLQNGLDIDSVSTFSQKEKLALRYALLITQTPAIFPPDFVRQLKEAFSEREIVILATTAAQVNYWARLIHALGVPPAGFTDNCAIPHA
jgi:alkylhydroperoxidase family enzyme